MTVVRRLWLVAQTKRYRKVSDRLVVVWKRKPLNDTWICALSNRKKWREWRKAQRKSSTSPEQDCDLEKEVPRREPPRWLRKCVKCLENSEFTEFNHWDIAEGKPAARDWKVNGWMTGESGQPLFQKPLFLRKGEKQNVFEPRWFPAMACDPVRSQGRSRLPSRGSQSWVPLRPAGGRAEASLRTQSREVWDPSLSTLLDWVEMGEHLPSGTS